MNRVLTGLAVAVSLAACGPSWSGKVSGYSLEQREALFTPLTDSKGAPTGGLIVLGDTTGLCAQLAATRAPSDATLVAFHFSRQADGKPLSPDTGDYVIGASSQASASAVGVFFKTDANGTSSVPRSNRMASSGLLEVTQLSLSDGTLTGHFDGKFGVQNDAVFVSFRASRCQIDPTTIGRGFLADAFGGVASPPSSSSGAGGQSAECAQLVACANQMGTGGQYESTYGPNGSCWTSASQASSCTQSCTSALQSLRSAGYCN